MTRVRPARPILSASLALACLSFAAPTVEAQPIFDEENPGTPAAPEPPESGGMRIVDDENPAAGRIIDDENPAAGRIVDDENPVARPSEAPASPAPSSGVRLATFRGRASSTLLLDLRADAPGEDTVETFQLAGARIRMGFHERFTATVEGRLTWWTQAGPATGEVGWWPDADEWNARFEAELRDAFVAARFDNLFLRVGQMSVRWGSSDLTSPGDIVHPVDLRNPLLLQGTDARIPLPMVDASLTWDRVQWQALFLPFFLPSRFAVQGSDFALARPGTPAGDALPTTLVDSLLHPSLSPLIQPLLQQTELPPPLASGASAGTRLTFRPPGWDVSAAYLFDWDRTPRVAIRDSVRQFLRVLDERGPDELSQLDAELLGALGEIQADREAGHDLVRATYHRRHTVVVDGVTYLGPIGVRFDATWSPARTWSTTDLQPVRRPTFAGAIGLGWESPTGHQIVATEVFHQRVFLADDDARLLFETQDITALLGAWRIQVEEWTSGPWRDLGFDVAATWFPRLEDLGLTAQVRWRFSEESSLTAGVALLESWGDRATLVRSFDSNDSAWLRWESSF